MTDFLSKPKPKPISTPQPSEYLAFVNLLFARTTVPSNSTPITPPPKKQKLKICANFKRTMSHPGKLKKWRANEVRKKYMPLSQVGEVLRGHAEHPALLKWLERSNVSGGFLLALNIPFCRAHLPVEDTMMVLETETGDQYEAKYLATGKLSGGWRRFAIDMKLEQGDGVVFHLVAPTKFKVYFVRANSEDEVHLPFHHLNLVIQKRSARSKEGLQEKQKELKADSVWSKVLLIPKGKLKKVYADKIRRKYLPIFQGSRKCNMIEARMIQPKLNDEQPVIVQWLKYWNVFQHPSLVFPRPFCTAYLPKVDTIMVLKTDSGEQYKTKYLPRMCRLSGGWVMFAKKMQLEEGDAVVFHLVEPAKFKVHIIHANSKKEVSLPFHLLKLVFHAKRSVSSVEDSSPLNFYKGRQVQHKHLQGKQKVLRADKVPSNESKKVLEVCHAAHGKRFQSNLNIEHPVTMKRMTKSTVSVGSSMRLTPAYCRAYLPNVDTTMLLETETGEQYKTQYLPRGNRLSGGWSRFAMNMKLEEADVIFRLVDAAKFMVYVIKANSADEVNLPPHIHDLVNLSMESVSSKAKGNQLSAYRSRKEHQKNSHGIQKQSMADKIWRKNLHRSQALRKRHVVQSKLNAEHPVTVKWLLKSDILDGFSLPLPTQFCRAYLPLDDTSMTLETEVGERYETKYLALCSSLDSGWGRLVEDKQLEAGDAVIFHLVEATKFKVYIIRANSNEVNLPVHLLRLLTDVSRRVSCRANNKHRIAYSRGKEHQAEENYSWKSADLNFSQNSLSFPEGILFSSIESFEEFKAVVYDELHELPNDVLHDYYRLCCSQNAFLHAQLFKGINPRLRNQTIVGAIRRIIVNTVNLADALGTCKLSTFLHEYAVWDKTLKTYEALGMNVGFLCARLHHLKNLAVSLEGATDRIHYEEACHERGCARNEARKLELMLAKLKFMQTLKLNPQKENYKEVCSWLECVKAETSYLENLSAELWKLFEVYDAHIETLKLKAKTHALKFSEEVSAP